LRLPGFENRCSRPLSLQLAAFGLHNVPCMVR
jgi:hypothetical protein